MGRDKARLRLGRHSLLWHIRAAALATGLPVRVIRKDLVARCGPLGGIYTALQTTGAEAVLFLSCDMPFISGELLLSLARRLPRRVPALFVKEATRAGFPFIIRRAGLNVVEKHLKERVLSLQALANALEAKNITLPRRRAELLFNVNTLADWAVARKRWRTKLSG